MARDWDIPKLLEQYMAASGGSPRWVTVSEFRTYFHLDECSAPAISGFFKRIFRRSLITCPYRVDRIEKVTIRKPQRRVIRRYLVTRHPATQNKGPEGAIPLPAAQPAHGVLTDSGAIEIFDRVLQGWAGEGRQ